MASRRKQLSFMVERFKGFWNQYRRSKRGLLGIGIITFYALVALIGPMVLPLDPLSPLMPGYYPGRQPKVAGKLCVPIWYKSILGMTHLSENLLGVEDHELTDADTFNTEWSMESTPSQSSVTLQHSTTQGSNSGDGCAAITYTREEDESLPSDETIKVTLSKEFEYPFEENPRSIWWHYSIRIANRSHLNWYTLKFTLENVEDISPYHYEGWMIIDENTTRSIGKFTTNSSGNLYTLAGDPIDEFYTTHDPSNAESFAITIEPPGDTDAIPSTLILLQGNQTESKTTISFPVDLTNTNGTYVLATPTDGNNTNELSGLWFMQWPPSAGLELPILPEGWTYAGWVVNSNMTVQMGNFTSSGGADSFNGYSSTIEQPYGFPGEDFLINPPGGLSFPLNLTDGASQVMVSVEPSIGVQRPFFIRPLLADILGNAENHTVYSMNQNLDSIPTGTVKVEDLDFPVRFTVHIRREDEADSIEVSKSLLSNLVIDPKWFHMAGQPEEGEALERSIFTGAGSYTLELGFIITDPGYNSTDFTIYLDNTQLICYGKAYGLLGTSSIPRETPRDLFTMLVHGTRISFMIGILTAVFSVLIGLFVGLVAGYVRGLVDEGLMRFADFLMVLPGLPLLIVLVTVLGRSIWNIIGVLIFMGWMGFSRSVRSMVLSLRERPFIESAKASGAGTGYIIYRHILPNVFALVYISLATSVPGAVISEASLAWLGLGDINIPSWGVMLYDFSRTQTAIVKGLGEYWFWVIPPGIAIAAMAMAFILMGFALDEILNPRLRRRR